MLQLIGKILIIWIPLGLVVMLFVRSPKNIKREWIRVLLSGPIGWIIFLYICLTPD